MKSNFFLQLLLPVLLLLSACSRSNPSAPELPRRLPKLETNVAAGFNFLLADSLRGTLQPGRTILPPPGQEQGKLDVAGVEYFQAARRAVDCDRSTYEATTSVERFFGPKFGPLNAPELALWGELLGRVLADTEKIDALEKVIWRRPRPPIDHPEIRACVPLPQSSGYPSGHSTEAHVLALVLTSLDPSRAGDFEARAEQIGQDRVIAGVHYPTDVEAGKALARIVFRELEKSPEFAAELSNLRLK
jgi:acid phosphatase (class A)